MESLPSINIPNDILEDILLRLPVNQLLQLKSVCKHWYALIRDYVFIKRHYQLQYANAKHVVAHIDETPNHNQGGFDLVSNGDDDVLNLTPKLVRDMSPALANESNNREPLTCMGVVNGIVGLQWKDCRHLALWNPATGEFKEVLFRPDILESNIVRNIIGFGFDVQSNDFKILGFTRIGDIYDNWDNLNCEFYVYSLRTNSWKSKKLSSIKSLGNNFFSVNSGAYLDDDGVCYWLRYNGSDRLAGMSFNFSSETFEEFEIPEGIECRCDPTETLFEGRPYCTCHKYMVTIGKYKAGLAIFVSHYKSNAKREEICNAEIWRPTRFRDGDYQVPSSWQLLSTIGPIETHDVNLSMGGFRVFDDLLLFQIESAHRSKRGTYFCDPFTNTVKKDKVGSYLWDTFSYVESLFLLH